MPCHTCRAEAVVNKGRAGEPPLCAECWLRTFQAGDPDVQYFLSVVERTLPNPLPGAALRHTVGDLLRALPLVRTVSEMRRFHRGYAGWLDFPGEPRQRAEHMATVNLGCLTSRAGLSFWRRLLWRWSVGAVPSDSFFG